MYEEVGCTTSDVFPSMLEVTFPHNLVTEAMGHLNYGRRCPIDNLSRA